LIVVPRMIAPNLADQGPLFVQLKFITSPVMAYLLWRKGDLWLAILALLWPPLGVFIAKYVLMFLQVPFSFTASVGEGRSDRHRSGTAYGQARLSSGAAEYATVVMVTGALITGFTVLSAFTATRVYISEQFPTALRGRGHIFSESTVRLFAGGNQAAGKGRAQQQMRTPMTSSVVFTSAKIRAIVLSSASCVV
jgi:hypothetical protein